MPDKSILMLRLEGPMQSWGSGAHWDYRESDSFPTKSGVVGILACALGCSYDDPRILDLHNDIRIGIRADRPGVRMVDYQTVSGNPLLNAAGKRRSGGQIIISRREYLSDASFVVACEGPRSRIRQLSNALQHPAWPCYLGRKSYVPSRPIYDGMHDEYVSVEDALSRHPIAERADDSGAYVCELDSNLNAGATFSRTDDRVGVPERRFSSRYVARMEIPYVPDENRS